MSSVRDVHRNGAGKEALYSMKMSGTRKKNRGIARQVFRILPLFAAVFLLSACQSAGNHAAADSSSAAEAEEPEFAVLLVTDSEIAENSIEERTRTGIEAFMKKHPQAAMEELVEKDWKKVVSQISGYDAAVFVGTSFSGIGEAAGKQNGCSFIVIDSTIEDADGEILSLRNVCTVTFRAEEEGFLAGVGAALSPDADRVTADLGSEDPEGALLLGFEDGLEYAAGTYGADNTGFEVTDVKSDGDGITIKDADGRTITQIRREPQGTIEEQLEKIQTGSFRGQDLIVGVREGGIDYVSEDGKHLLTADALRKLKLTKDMLASEERYGRIT